MIEMLGAISTKLRWAKVLVCLLGVCFFGLFVSSIFNVPATNSDEYLLPSVVGVIWSALFFLLIATFSNIPSKPLKQDKFFVKLKVRIKRSGYHVLGVIFVVLTIAVLMLSFKMFGIWHAQ
ncbi:MAG: hypothetical protein KUG79_15965 [Pseudomonadales bacterium]|nr:hypothetical protein [Pseudomonadales bacterium]